MIAMTKMSALTVFLLIFETVPTCSGPIGSSGHPSIIAEYSVPGDSSDFMSMTTGPDGALWFTDIGSNAIGRIDPASQVLRRFPLPAPHSNPMGIAVGSDGALWFAETSTSMIGRISTSGELREFATPWGRIAPYTLAAGPDGALWFSASGEGLGSITTDGHLSLHALPSTYVDIRWMVTGPDRNIWFIDNHLGGYDRRSPAGTVSRFHLSDGSPRAILSCPDGHLWMPSYGPLGSRETYRIFRVSTDGRAVEHRLPNPDPAEEATVPTPRPGIAFEACPGGRCGPSPRQTQSFGIAGCSENAVWFWIGPDHVGSIDVKTGAIVEYHVDSHHLMASSPPRGRVVWYFDERAGKLFEVAVP
jgi:virginiamycin B lyase